MADTGSSEVPKLALQYAVMTRQTTDDAAAVIRTARKFEDYLRGDRDYNDKINAILDVAVNMAAQYKASLTGPSTAVLDDLLAKVQKVKQLP